MHQIKLAYLNKADDLTHKKEAKAHVIFCAQNEMRKEYNEWNNILKLKADEILGYPVHVCLKLQTVKTGKYKSTYIHRQRQCFR
jgi:hypothetical protein